MNKSINENDIPELFEDMFALTVQVSQVLSASFEESAFDSSLNLIDEAFKSLVEFDSSFNHEDYKNIILSKFEEWSEQSPSSSKYLSRSEYIASSIMKKKINEKLQNFH